MSDGIIRAVFFALLVPLTHLSIKWIWKAIYRSSHKKEEVVEQYETENLQRNKKNSRVTAWVIDTSPNPTKTQLLVYIYYALLLPAFAGMALSSFGVVDDIFDPVLKLLIIIEPIIILVSIIIGFIYNKTAKEIDFDEIKISEITTLESQRLADHADNYSSGKFKDKFRYKPSDLPKYIFLTLWFAGLIFMGVIAVRQDIEHKNSTQTQSTESSAYEQTEISDLSSELKPVLEEQNMLVVDGNLYFKDKVDGFVGSMNAYKNNTIIFEFYQFNNKVSARQACLYYIDNHGISGGELTKTDSGIRYQHTDRTMFCKVAEIDNVAVVMWCPLSDIPELESIFQIVEDKLY